MRSLEACNIDVAQLYALCAEQKRDEKLKARLVATAPQVLEASVRYDNCGAMNSFHQFDLPLVPAGGATVEDLVNLYETALVPQNGRGRWAYDRIKLSAPNGVCPYCGHMQVRTLDHYLPKRPYGLLSLTTRNLIPSCFQCNKLKLTAAAFIAEQQLFHPYFDNFDDAQWLRARIRQMEGPRLEFFVENIEVWSDIKQARVRHHFALLQLGSMYSVQASVELSNLKYRLTKIFEAGGPQAVRGHLIEEALTRAVAYRNSWQTAMYSALAQDDEFIEHGFNEI